MKKYLLTITILFTCLSAFSAEKLHYTDTLDTAAQQKLLLTALELAPEYFVYDSMDGDGASYVSVIGLRFNESFKNILKSDFASDDPGFRKRFKRLYNLLRPLNIVCNLKVTYTTVPAGIAIAYDITDPRIWGRKAKAKEFENIK